MPQKIVEALLAEMAALVHWAIYGFNAEPDNAWKTAPGGFAAAFDARRQHLAEKSAPTGS